MIANPTRSTAQRIAIILAVFFQIGASFLPSLGIGEQIGSRSDEVRSLITPAGWAFAIWGPLYLGSVLLAIYQALPAQRDSDLLARIGWPAAGVFAANGLWALYTQLNALTAVSVIIIATGLACVLTAYRRLVDFERPFTTAERWLVMLPLSALAAWLTAATIVNITSTAIFYGIGGDGQYPSIAAAIIVVGGIIASLAIWRGRGNPVYALVFCWALLAIYLAGGQRAALIALAAIAAAALVIGATALKLRDPASRVKWLG
ncbi:hypothetical protein [Aurantiacibacter luteus]|uniref:Tryptophan-rich sensory protein n=1 Tax=Aurantiacibacter luteus TaxID=1581420 RepID=A0A0G9MYA2_9SPHN|nr:hypothetical protein [Aurantiacibacter luteus]KLE35574.1 hypothetical protein AAW00_03920 [Aurantiacibacter luteus]